MDDVLERWRKYCASLYDCIEDTTLTNGWSTDEPDLLPSEVEQAIKALESRKSHGKDGVTGELLKLQEVGVTLMTKLCNLVWESGIWPEEWPS